MDNLFDIKLEKSLTGEEFTHFVKLYEEMTGRFFLPTEDVDSQIIWLCAVEQAKKYFQK